MDWRANSTFDPFDQTFTVLAPDGKTPIIIPLAFVNKVQLATISAGICQGTQIGAAALLLICLLLVTKTDKRRSLIFILNALALLLVIVRGVFTCIVYTGPLYDWYRYETYYYKGIGTAQVVAVWNQVVGYLLLVVLEMSLMFQVRVVCCTLEPRWRHLINIFNALVAVLVAGAHLGLLVLNIRWNILGIEHLTAWQFDRTRRLAFAGTILFVVSIGISTAIFCGKLAFAIHRRRSMGMTQFGPMQVIFIMGCQTMCAPFIFTIITYYGVQNLQMQNYCVTAVALCLPLSSMWAAANANNSRVDQGIPTRRHNIPFGRANLSTGKGYGISNTSHSGTLTDDKGTISSDGTGVGKVSQSA